MVLTLTLLLSTLLVAAMLVTALVPQRAAAWVASATNVVQLHTVSILGIYPSLAVLSWLALWRSPLSSPLWRWPWMQALLLLAAAQAASLLWSPNPVLGVRYFVYFLVLPFAAHAFYRLSSEHPELALSCMRLLLIGSALEAVLVIAFRLLPSLELAFLAHPIAGLFVPPNTLDALFYESRNNVFDAAKSGGLFVNANIAAAYLGISAIAAWYLGKTVQSTSLRAVAVLNWCAVLFTGSKAGLLCALVLPLALALASAIRVRRINPLTLFAAVFALGAAGGIAFVGEDLFTDFSSNTLSTLVSREEIWRYAIGLLQEHPFAGLGFGGWEERFALHAFMTGSTTIVPAHNSFFILWLQSGLPGLLGGVFFVAAVYAAVIRCMNARDPGVARYALGAAGAFTWYVVQGLGENFGLVGEVHMTPLLGVMLGHLCARYDAVMVRHEYSEPVRGRAAPSAVPAI